MIKHIIVKIESLNGVSLTSTWYHPTSRTRLGKMPVDPMEWFKKLLYEHGYQIPEPMDFETPPQPRHINGKYDG